MFTGIVETTGKIQQIEQRGDIITFAIKSDILTSVSIDQSVAIDGVCLTVVKINDKIAEFNLVPQTLLKTTLGDRKTGDQVNLERSISASAQIGGHFVQGHIDCTGKITDIKDFGESREYVFEIHNRYRTMIIPRGSIAIDGISLTIAQLEKCQFRVAIIPHTLELTTLKFRTIRDQVNLEFDMIGKYIVNTMEIWKEQNG